MGTNRRGGGKLQGLLREAEPDTRRDFHVQEYKFTMKQRVKELGGSLQNEGGAHQP